MKKVFFVIVVVMGCLAVNAQQFNETATQLTATKELVVPILLSNNEIRIANAFAPTDPSIGTYDNSGYGINIHKTSGIGFAFNGVHKTIITPSGEIISPVMKLDNELRIANTFMPSDPSIGTYDNSGYGINIHKTNGIGFAFNGVHKIFFKPNGNMAVHGKIESKEVKVTLTPTADFVFENNYDLPTLEFIEKHIKEKKHLPEIASAKEMQKEGVNIGKFQIQLLQKIEELTLYTIEQQKEIERLKQIEKRLEKLEKMLLKKE